MALYFYWETRFIKKAFHCRKDDFLKRGHLSCLKASPLLNVFEFFSLVVRLTLQKKKRCHAFPRMRGYLLLVGYGFLSKHVLIFYLCLVY